MSNLVGTGLNQVPTNGMLGGLAYQDPNHASIKDLDLKNLSQINSEIADTAVDVFVYDTRKDSDGGAWRKRTQNTSWYNETLRTATRGTRKEFPVVAVIVAESTKVTIYDGDDPDLPMWMVFNLLGAVGGNSNMLPRGGSGTESDITSIACLNGRLAVGLKDVSGSVGEGLAVIDFISELSRIHRTTGSGYTGAIYNLSISGRNSNGRYSGDYNTLAIAADTINDVAMTVLPNAPVDSATGLPIPTIAVATDGVTSVIRDDETVADYTGFNPIEKVAIDSKYAYASVTTGGNDYIFKAPLLSADGQYDVNITAGSGGWYANSTNNGSETPTLKNMTVTDFAIAKDSTVFRSGTDGIEVFGSNVTTIDANEAELPIAYITSDYNTGYQYGRIKGTFLADADVEDGVELVSNGTFDASSSGWTVAGGGNVAISSGQAQLTNDGTNNSSLDQTVTTVVGKTYKVSADISPQGGGPMPRLYVGNRWVQVGNSANVQQTLTLIFTAYSTSTIVSINANTNVSNAVTLADNVTMKLTNDISGTNLITNGTFDSNVSGWGSGNGATLTHQNNGNPGGNVNVLSGASSNGYASQINKVAVGKYYTLSFDHYHVNGTQGYVNIGTALGGSQYVYQELGTSSSWTTYSFTVKATGGELFTGFYSRPNGNVRYDNISLKEVEEDRSVNNNPLQVFGTVTKSAVATGAELVSYNFSGSASNYLTQPYNSNLNFGTGDFSVVYWFNQTTHATHQDVINRTDAGQNDGSWLIQHDVDGTILFYIRSGGSYTSIFSGGGSLTNRGWIQVVISRSGTALKQYHNGVEVEDGSSSLSLTLNGAELQISTRVAVNNYPILAGNSIALARISGSAPSPAQVKKMYDDEKCLFHENAKATLYGSSDAVTALAYDDTTELLHVGTSAGRSEFQGLRRINNTTTAVTTAISASNDLVAEQ